MPKNWQVQTCLEFYGWSVGGMDHSTWISTSVTEKQLIPYKIVLVFCWIFGLYLT